MNQLDTMRQKMLPIVNQCLEKRGGRRKLFDELDSLIKSDVELMASYLKYAVEKENDIRWFYREKLCFL